MPLIQQEIFIAPALCITHPQPNEVRRLMNEDPRKLGAGAIKGDPAFAKEGSGMDRTAAIAQTAGVVNADGIAAQFRQAAQDAICVGGVIGIVEQKNAGGVHPC